MTINFYEQVYAVVRRIPRGKVTSYGRIAAMLGRPQAARAVGYALNALRDKQDDPAYQNIPWQRVVNSQGRISIVSPDNSPNRQAQLLREEGVEVSEHLKIDLDVYLWEGLHLLEIDDIQSGSRLVD
ncbi:MAG: MGMT family protein [Anaerolineae bacterium]|nr:MGMT family protein [Anaerolineae bacterium]